MRVALTGPVLGAMLAALTNGVARADPGIDIAPSQSIATLTQDGGYTLGDQLQLLRRSRIPVAGERNLADGYFEVRIFAVSAMGAPPSPFVPRPDCDVFVTTVYRHMRFSRNSLTLLRLEDPQWLKATYGSIGPGNYVLVIEQETPMTSKALLAPNLEIFRLNAASEPSYFTGALYFSVSPHSGSVYNVAAIAGTQAGLTGAMTGQAGKRYSGLACLDAHLVADPALGGAQIAQLDACPVATQGIVPTPGAAPNG